MQLQINEELRNLIPPIAQEEYDELEQSILKEGCRDSLIVWQNTIIDGHNRYEICKKHDIKFNTVERHFEDILEVKVYMIRNQFARRNISLYQRAVLALELKPIIAEQARKKEQKRKTTFPKSEKSNLATINTTKKLAEQAGVSHDTISKVEKIEEKATPKVKEQLSKGEISINKAYTNIKNQEKKEELKNKSIEIAENYKKSDSIKIIHDDCTNYLKSLNDNSIDLIVIDPPYYGIVEDDWDNQWKTTDEYLEWCRLWMKESLKILKDTGSFYIWGSIGEKSDVFLHQKLLLDEIGFHFKDWITWKKRRGLGNRKGWLYTREECLWYVKDNNKFFWNEDEQYSDEKSEFTKGFSGHELKSENKRITNVWSDIPEQLSNKGILHYTPKPLKAIERIINTSTIENQLVLDFFAGSGTTGVACKKLNRNCILVEKDDISINEIKRRLTDEI